MTLNAHDTSGLGPAGTTLVEGILADLPEGVEYSAVELATLGEAGRAADLIAALEAEVASGGVVSVGSTKQPVVAAAVKEIRLQRVALVKILESLAIPEETETPRQARARTAATSRWTQRRAVRERRG